MAVSLSYSAARTRLRHYVNDREALLGVLRGIRYGLIQGPWHPWLVRFRQFTSSAQPLPAGAATGFSTIDVEEAVDQLNRDAYTDPALLDGPRVDELVALADGIGDRRLDNPHLDGGPVLRLALDPQIVAVARRYLGAEPILFRTQLYWTLPRPDAAACLDAAAEHGRFHYDISDSRSVTVFVYLSDVDEECGPHVVLRGTHGRRGLLRGLSRFITEEEIARRYPGRLHMITGRRGTAWFEDITCYHRQAPALRPRLMLSVIYTLHRRPVAGDLA